MVGVATPFYMRFQLHALFIYKKCWCIETYHRFDTPTFIIEPFCLMVSAVIRYTGKDFIMMTSSRQKAK